MSETKKEGKFDIEVLTKILGKNPNWLDNKRFQLKEGKFGMYFYDCELEKHMELKRVLKLLNLYCLFSSKEQVI